MLGLLKVLLIWRMAIEKTIAKIKNDMLTKVLSYLHWMFVTYIEVLFGEAIHSRTDYQGGVK
jgi:uncharacterized membrane protein